MLNEVYFPKKEIFKDPAFRNMCEYRELASEFEKDYEGTWAKLALKKIHGLKISNKRQIRAMHHFTSGLQAVN